MKCADASAHLADRGPGQTPSGELEAMEHAREQVSIELLGHLNALYNLARWLVRDPGEAEDLVQETYLKAIRAAHQFQPGARLRTWLFQILRNTFYTQYRRKQREPETVAPEILEALASAKGVVFGGDRVAATVDPTAAVDLKVALLRLPEEYRFTILLADLEGFTMKEIATIMACPVGTVKSRLFRARAILKELLHDYVR